MKRDVADLIVCFMLGSVAGLLFQESFRAHPSHVVKAAPYTLMRMLCLFDNDVQPGDYVTLSNQAAGHCHAVKGTLIGVPIIGVARQTGKSGDDVLTDVFTGEVVDSK